MTAATYHISTCHLDTRICLRVTTDATPRDLILGLRAQGAIGTAVYAPSGEVTYFADLDPREDQLARPVVLPLPVSRSRRADDLYLGDDEDRP